MRARDLAALAFGMALYRIASHVDSQRKAARAQWLALLERINAKGRALQ